MTHDEIMLSALKSGPKTNHELYRLGIMVHSRAASLRKKGHVIACKREGRNTYVYWLEAGACADPSRGAGAPASSGPPASDPEPVEARSTQLNLGLEAA